MVLPRLWGEIASRLVIEQAKGYLHEALDISPDSVFDLMRKHARAEGHPLTSLVRTIINDVGVGAALLKAMSDQRA